MAQASIHFEPVKGGSEEHNKRLKFLDYVHPERTHLNEYEESDTQAHRLAIITKNYLDHHPKRKKLHAKATPIREAVVNIEEWTTMNDLKKLAKRLHERFGIEIFQIAIHKDEGYFNSENGDKLNLHAHLVADWTNHETGESLKLSRQDMAEMQTINAECLGMERGVSSDKKHLSAMQYKEKKAREEAESLANVVEAARSDLHGLQARKNAIEQEILMKAQEKEEAEKIAAEARAKAKQAEAAALSGLVVGGTKKIGNLLGIGKEAKQLKELPQQLAAAKEEGRTEGKKEAIAEVLKEARLNFGDKEVTSSMIGRAWRGRFDEAEMLNERVKNLQNSDSYRDKLFQMLAEIPIIKQCLAIIRYFVAHDLRQFEREDIKPLQMALQGDESQASTLMQTARYGSIYNKPHLSDRWEKAEEEMRKIARGENLEQNQERSQGLRWHR